MMTMDVREASLADVATIEPLLRAAHRLAGAPYLSVSPLYTLQSIETGLREGASALLVDGDPIHSFAWVESLTDGDLLIHEIYASPGQSFGPLYDAVEQYARAHDCKGIVGLTYRLSVARLLRKHQMRPIAVLMRKEVV